MARLLLLDDDEGTVRWMAAALEARGHEVRGFTRVIEALDALDGWTPELVVSDILMPEMDGLTFARLVRKHRGVPVMFVSVAKKQAEAVLAGARGYLQKPATAAEVRAAVDRVLGREAARNTVLIVDDDESTRELCHIVLEPRFVVIDAENGALALEVMAKHRVDLAIVDVHMPVMNGVELIRRMRATPELDRVPVIVQTSDQTALQAPVWRDLQISQLLDKGDFLEWLSRQIDLHVRERGGQESAR
jgi:CheY-like chemotaxis protein